uniref:Uncharacterized protein n=1 Tax=Oryzias melastigma TaxID=30732 RepID=A0A3B3DXR5_ORYME
MGEHPCASAPGGRPDSLQTGEPTGAGVGQKGPYMVTRALEANYERRLTDWVESVTRRAV